MKARLTIVFEKEIDNDDMLLLKEAEIDRDDETINEIFDIGWDGALERKLEFMSELGWVKVNDNKADIGSYNYD